MKLGHPPLPEERAADVREAWDGLDPPIHFDDLVNAWQWAIWRYDSALQLGVAPTEAWATARPGTFREPLDKADDFGRALLEMAGL